jgi:hypothetical protein
MNAKKLLSPACLVLVAAVAVVASLATADTSGQPQLPQGWTEADMQAVIAAGTPGKQHELLAECVGSWRAKTTMWMTSEAEPIMSEGTSKAESFLDGRFVKVEMDGEMPGMGPYHGFGLYGFDNVSQQFVSIWADNHGTGIMNGVGELSEDGKTLTWNYTVNCPIAKGPTPIREVETILGPDSRTIEMFGTDPKSGTEFKMMHIELTRE